MSNSKEIAIYKSKDGAVELQINVDEDTVWLPQTDIAKLFSVQKAAISKHVQNIYKSAELKPKETVSKMETIIKEGKKTVKRTIEYYNLDMIISIGYRVNSKQATQFRIWATNVLRQHLLKGYTINEPRLQAAKMNELKNAVLLIKQAMQDHELTGDESAGLLKVITDYTDTWLMLDQYDRDQLEEPTKQRTARYTLEYDEALSIIRALKTNLMRRKQASELFGQEKGNALKRILGAIEQTFDGKDLYTSVEAKASHLLYFLTKDHPFVDGNKRIAAFLFIVYLTRTQYLNGRDGERKFNDNALVALVLLIAQSEATHKDLIMKLVMNFVHGK